MDHFKFAAGAAEISIQELYEAAFARKGRFFDEPKHQQMLRCLVFSHRSSLTVILNIDWGFWLKPYEKICQVIEELAPDCSVQVLGFPTQVNGNIDLDICMTGALDEHHKKHFDPVFQQEFLNAVAGVFRIAYQSLRPARIAAGRGSCSSITIDSFRPQEPVDTAVNVLRIADSQSELIAVVVNFGCRSDDVEQELSAGIAGALESLVQKVYGSVPVLFTNAAGGQFYKLMHHVPPFQNGKGKVEAMQSRKATLASELDRIGRVLGGEVCKVLAELEVAGAHLEAQNQRHLATSWIKQAAGTQIDEPTLIVRAIPLALSYASPPSVEECEARIKELEAQIKPLQKKLPFQPIGNVTLPLDCHDTSSDNFRWMELVAARKLWGGRILRAKQTYRLNRKQWTWEGTVQIVAFSHELVVIGIPGLLYGRTVAELQRRSPFNWTQIWGMMMPWSLGILIPPEDLALGTPHSFTEFSGADINRMIDSITTSVQVIYNELNNDK